jgi:hypothetical protein
VPGDALAVADDGTPGAVAAEAEPAAAEAPEGAAPAAADVAADTGAAATTPIVPGTEFPEDAAALVPLSTVWTTPLSRVDVVAGLIGAEAGAAIGLLLFGGTPFLPIGVTFAATAAGPLGLRLSRPVRQHLFRHWLRSQLRAGPRT